MTVSPNHDRPAGAWIVAGAIFLVVAGIGAALSYMGDAPAAIGEGDTISLLLSRSESNNEVLQRLDIRHVVAGEESRTTKCFSASRTTRVLPRPAIRRP